MTHLMLLNIFIVKNEDIEWMFMWILLKTEWNNVAIYFLILINPKNVQYILLKTEWNNVAIHFLMLINPKKVLIQGLIT